jgi:hypothetical protein
LNIKRPWIEGQRGYTMPEDVAALLRSSVSWTT